MNMVGSMQKPHGPDNRDARRSAWHDSGWAYLGLVLLAPAIYVVSAYASYRRGGVGWLSALGLPLDREALVILGGFVVLVVITVLMLQKTRRLSPSREKTTLTRIGNLQLAILFVWPWIYVMLLY